MRDEDDRGAGVGALSQGREQGRRLVGGEDGRGLVEDQHVRRRRERAGDFDALAGADGQRVDTRVRIPEFEAERVREPGDAEAARARALEGARVAVEEREVVRDLTGADEEVVLRHEGEPGIARVARPPEGHRVAGAENLARVRREAPRSDRHEGGLARPVLAEEGVDLPREDDEAGFGKRLRRAEALRDSAEFEGGVRKSQKFPRGTVSAPERIFSSAAFSSSRTG